MWIWFVVPLLKLEKNLSCVCIFDRKLRAKTFLYNYSWISIVWASLCLPAIIICWYLFWQEHGLGEPQLLCWWFITVVLIKTLPDSLSRLIFTMTLPFFLAKSASWFLVLSLNWIHSQISGITLGIIWLTNFKNWISSARLIYHSIWIIR